MSKYPVVVAIPNYNMAIELKTLLPQLLGQGYADIFVLDDASTDNSLEVVKGFKGKVKFVAGDKNKGAGANRNRIIDVLEYDAFIHFLDADVELETNKAADIVRDIMPDGPVGCVGGLAKTKAGLQNVWNYGPRPGLRNEIGAFLQSRIELLLTANPDRARRLEKRYHNLLADWPNPLATPRRREVYWNIEQNFVIRSDTFAQLGGFDESLRETEILELAIRMHQMGLKSYFDPRLATRHMEAKVRNYNRMRRKRIEGFKIARKHGSINWILSRDGFKF